MIGTFIMGFGGGGAIAQYTWEEMVRSSFTGLGTGFVMGGFMYLIMRLMYGQQSTSLIKPRLSWDERERSPPPSERTR